MERALPGNTLADSNPFDQFDAPPPSPSADAPAANPFDQFDTHSEEMKTPIHNKGNLLPSTNEFGDLAGQPWAQGDQPSESHASAAGRIMQSAYDAYHNTPALLTPEAQEWVDKNMGVVGQTLVNPAMHIAGAIPAALNAGAAGVSQTAMETLGERGGRDALDLLSILPMARGERMSPNVATPKQATEPSRPRFMNEITAPDVSEMDPRNAISTLINHDISENPPRAADAGTANQWAPPDIPTVQAIKTAVAARDIPKTSAAAKSIANAFYQITDRDGAALSPDFANRLVDEASKIAEQTDQGRATVGETPIGSLVSRWQDAVRGTPITIQAAQEMDQGLGKLIDREYGPKGLSGEGRDILELQSTFRNMILNAGPEDISGGTKGFDAMNNARLAWSQAMKLDDLERIQARANRTDNPATSIKNSVNTLLSNRVKSRGYTPDETAALEQAAKRGVLGGALQVFGSRLIPIGLTAHGIFSLNPASLAAGVAGMAGSAAARAGATALQNRRLRNAATIIGSRVPVPPASIP